MAYEGIFVGGTFFFTDQSILLKRSQNSKYNMNDDRGSRNVQCDKFCQFYVTYCDFFLILQHTGEIIYRGHIVKNENKFYM